MTNAVAQEVSYASLGQRALAFFLDSIVWLVLLGQIAANIPADVYEDAPVVVGVIFLGLFSVAFNYFWFAEWKFGKTLGKAIVSIHVTTEDGERLRFGPATVRNIMRLIDVFGIGPIMIRNSSATSASAAASHIRSSSATSHHRPARFRRAPFPHRRTRAKSGTRGCSCPGSRRPGAGNAARTHQEVQPMGQFDRDLTATWGPIHIVWAVLAIIVLVIAESAIVTIFDPDPDSGGGLLAIQGLVALNLVGVAFGFASLRDSPVVAPGRLGLRGFAPSALGIAALAYLAYIVFAAIYAPLFSPEQEDVTRDLGVDEGGVAAVVEC